MHGQSPLYFKKDFNTMAKPYISEATQFIESLKAQNPQLAQSQRDGRARLWDKAVDLQTLAIDQAGKLPNKAYAYFAKPIKAKV